MGEVLEEDILQITDRITFRETGGTNTVNVIRPVSLSGNVTFTFPNTNPVNGQVLVNNSGNNTWETRIKQPILEVYVLKDVKTLGTNGGTFTTGAWQTRDLNTLTVYPSGSTSISLSSNQLSISSGTYIIRATCPGVEVNNHQTRFFNVTDGVTLVLGSCEQNNEVNLSTSSSIRGFFNIAGTKVCELQHRSSKTEDTDGFGNASGIGTNEIYSVLKIIRIA